MQIASLIRYTNTYNFNRGIGEPEPTVYAATDPFDGELLTGWHNTINQVDDALRDLNDTVNWGLNTAAYAGESDVPSRPSSDSSD